jgi:hypothetical protein
MLHSGTEAWKSISNGKLKRLLNSLPEDVHIVPSGRSNLMLYSGKPGHEDRWQCIGYLDRRR